jgi:hypothetical protein
MSFVKAVMISVADRMHHFATCLLHIVMIDVDRLVVGRKNDISFCVEIIDKLKVYLGNKTHGKRVT